MIHPYFDLSGSDARGLLYGLMEVDKIQLRENPSMPSMRELVQNGKVRYRRADPEEHWQSYKELVEQVESNGVAYGDCEDLASAIAAEDQVRYGVTSLPYAYSPKEGLFHVVTAVPKDRFGAIPQHHWPSAQYAPDVMGYVLQDPSVVAGMGSFGALPVEESMSTTFGAAGRHMYGAAPEPPRRRRGLGGLLGSFREGLLGNVRATDVARRLGSGARAGAGIKDDWATELGKSIPGQLGIAGPSEAPVSKGEADAVAVLKKSEEESAPEGEEEELLLEEEEEFGFEPEDFVGSPSWHADNLGNRVADDMFGAVDEPVYTMGVFQRSIEGSSDDLNEELGPRGRGKSLYRGLSHLERPAHLRPPAHMQKPGTSSRPLATFGNLGEGDEYGAFWHKKEKRQELSRARILKKLERLHASGKKDSSKWDRLVEKYVRKGGSEDDLEEKFDDDFGYISSEHLFGADDMDDLLFDEEMSELEDLDLELEAEGF